MRLFKASIITFFKTGIVSGAYYATIMFLLAYFRSKDDILDSTLWCFIGFGSFMGVISVIQLIYTYNSFNGKDRGDDIFKIRQNKSIISSISATTLYQRLNLDSYFNDEKISFDNNNAIDVNMGSSLFSFGERIKIKSSPIDNDQYEYQIISNPKIPFTLMDSGKNFENVIKLEHLLKY